MSFARGALKVGIIILSADKYMHLAQLRRSCIPSFLAQGCTVSAVSTASNKPIGRPFSICSHRDRFLEPVVNVGLLIMAGPVQNTLILLYWACIGTAVPQRADLDH